MKNIVIHVLVFIVCVGCALASTIAAGGDSGHAFLAGVVGGVLSTSVARCLTS